MSIRGVVSLPAGSGTPTTNYCSKYKDNKVHEAKEAANISLVDGLEHFLFSHILGIMIPID